MSYFSNESHRYTIEWKKQNSIIHTAWFCLYQDQEQRKVIKVT